MIDSTSYLKTGWIGKKFNYLTIVEKPFPYYVGKYRCQKVKCLCECGNIKIIDLGHIKQGTTKSCGCQRKKLIAQKIRKYTVNHNFFENINNQKNAYCLGLWCADGHNLKNEKGISISMIDLDIIGKIKKCLGYTGPMFKKKLPSEKFSYSLHITSLKLCQDLIKWGCVPRKSYCLEFPKNILDNLMSHFIRGFFDGDGCLSKRKDGYWYISIMGTKNICQGLQNYLGYGVAYLNCINPNTKHETWQWKIGSRNDIKTFLNYIYKDAIIYLDRKYKKYQIYIKS